jgi:predicted ArsR family transcriptional regulator
VPWQWGMAKPFARIASCYRAGMPASPPSGELAVVALLADPLRGRLYRLVRRQHPLSRDQAAGAVGISRGLAAFHLDKLVEGGLLRARYQAPPGRPPRVGRLPKVYEPSDLQVGITIPERRYDLVGEILLDAIAEATADEQPLAAATRIAMARGAELGAGFRQARGLGRLGPERALTVATEALEAHGYEPHRLDQCTVELRNCPFHTLARRAPEVICAINRSLLEGLLRGFGDQRVEAVLAPRPDACCVELRAPRSSR